MMREIDDATVRQRHWRDDVCGKSENDDCVYSLEMQDVLECFFIFFNQRN